ncbi:hypothetical protein B0H11DRAFT_2040799 [Mycena galericulata]|nr:hypothetical protein B0H11DRAFT_2040799 [Mycena galericulata]
MHFLFLYFGLVYFLISCQHAIFTYKASAPEDAYELRYPARLSSRRSFLVRVDVYRACAQLWFPIPTYRIHCTGGGMACWEVL